MAKRKIAVFANPWSRIHIGGILMGMKKRAEETDTDLYIFNNHGGFEGEADYNAGEYSLFNLPQIERFDGVLIASNDVQSTSRIPKLLQEVNKRKIPCICLDQEFEGAHFIGTDNYKAMYEMVEHLVTIHNCRTFNYVGGPSDHVENCLRKQAFRDVLEKHGIPVEEVRIRDYYFTKNSGKQAFVEFDELGLAMPDAVVCANDDMATGYVDAVLEHGYRIPEDVLITGFDYSSDGQNYFPEIASVQRSCEELGYAAVTHILEMADGKQIPDKIYAPHHLRPNCSCGCHIPPAVYAGIRRDRIAAEGKEKDSRWNIHCMQKRLLVCEDESEFKSMLVTCLGRFNIHNFCMMVNDVTFQKEYDYEKKDTGMVTGYPENMRMFVWTRQRDDDEDVVWVTKSELMPRGFADPNVSSHVFIVMPLHLNGVIFGYSVMEEGLEHILDGNLYYLLGVINASIENIRQSTYIQKLNKKLNRMSMLDAMTGLYNRFALNALGEPLLKSNAQTGKGTIFLFVDMDGLKVFNDSYGHDMGDAAIKYLADIMKESCIDKTYFCVRYGGDEFLMMGTCNDYLQAENMQKSIEYRISSFNKGTKLPGKLSVSSGYILAEPNHEIATMDYYISKADEMMYQIKKEKKRLKRLAEEAKSKEENKQ